MGMGLSIKRILVTGGCGFIGANFIRLELEVDPDISITNLDGLTYAGNPDNLADLSGDPRYHFVHGDIAHRATVLKLVADGGYDAIINFAAESHVDRSINDATPFLRTNILGTQCLLDAARQAKTARYVQVSTDEVYGTLKPFEPAFTESTPLAPNSPYAASKAGADFLVRAAYHTHGMNTVITRCSNNYGPYQFPEKLIPLSIPMPWQTSPCLSTAMVCRFVTGSMSATTAAVLPQHSTVDARGKSITSAAAASGTTST